MIDVVHGQNNMPLLYMFTKQSGLLLYAPSERFAQKLGRNVGTHKSHYPQENNCDEV